MNKDTVRYHETSQEAVCLIREYLAQAWTLEARLEALAILADVTAAATQDHVTAARNTGRSWRTIATALDTNPTTAQRHYTKGTR